MSKIYLLDSDTAEFRSLVAPEDDRFMHLVERFDGTRMGQSQTSLTVDYDPDTLHLPVGDFPSIFLRHIPVFSRRAAEVLSSLLLPNGELLPLVCGPIKYFAFNVTQLVDALNMKESDIVYYSSGRIMDVKSYVLDAGRIPSASIFKLRETALMDVFVNDEFFRTVNDFNLKGFTFKPVPVIE